MTIARSIEENVRDRYAEAARAVEPALCCPVDYSPALLEAIPAEVLEVDYGCGDPSKWLQSGETVLDLGSGSGKICFIAAQVVGESGRVIGVDFNPPMLALSRRAKPAFAAKVGYDNVEFLSGRIQDLALNLDALGSWLAAHPVADPEAFLAMQDQARRLSAEQPLIANDSIDVIVSSCVLNLVPAGEKPAMFREMHRVLRRGGRCVISDIVSDEPVPSHLQADQKLWSGCVSGAFEEAAFLRAFEDAGLYGVEIVERRSEPWRVVEGIEFRSVTVRAFKGKEGPCLERNQAVIYKGPFKSVVDDDGHSFHRGERTAVCDKTFHICTAPPYAASFEAVRPGVEVPLEEALPFDCSRRDPRRDPRQSKGAVRSAGDAPSNSDCDDPGCC